MTQRNNYAIAAFQGRLASLMAENDDIADFSHRLQLDRPAPPPRVDTLRSQGLRAPAAAKAAATAATAAPAGASQYELPGVVLLIGLYEFARAITLGVIYGMMLRDPHTHMYSQGFWTTFYVLSNGAVQVTPFLPLTILYALAEGVCLWMRVNWGRRVLIATSFWAVFRLARFLLLYQAVAAQATDAQIAQIGPVRDAAFMLAGVNVVIGLYLAFAPGVAEAFGQHK
jgi:hypothetical protein